MSSSAAFLSSILLWKILIASSDSQKYKISEGVIFDKLSFFAIFAAYTVLLFLFFTVILNCIEFVLSYLAVGKVYFNLLIDYISCIASGFVLIFSIVTIESDFILPFVDTLFIFVLKDVDNVFGSIA